MSAGSASSPVQSPRSSNKELPGLRLLGELSSWWHKDCKKQAGQSKVSVLSSWLFPSRLRREAFFRGFAQLLLPHSWSCSPIPPSAPWGLGRGRWGGAANWAQVLLYPLLTSLHTTPSSGDIPFIKLCSICECMFPTGTQGEPMFKILATVPGIP